MMKSVLIISHSLNNSYLLSNQTRYHIFSTWTTQLDCNLLLSDIIFHTLPRNFIIYNRKVYTDNLCSVTVGTISLVIELF